jgi:DNA topoisomerase I
MRLEVGAGEAEDSKALCRRHKLRYAEAAELALTRRRCGRGFAYFGADGKALKDAASKERIKKLAIPPAWTEVRIAAEANAHLQAIGRDAAGRLQYRYHPDWEQARAELKEQRLIRFGKALPRVRRAVAEALAAPRLTRKKMIAAVVRLIDRARLRPGYDEYAREDGGRGAATLLQDDVSVEGDKVMLAFHAKGGQKVRRVVKDSKLARVVRELAKRRGRRLFRLPGSEPAVSAREVNAFLAEASGQKISAKDFRTFSASAGALAALAETNGAESATAKRKAVIEAADQASQQLANTRAVARSSYIHPAVIKAYEDGKLEAALLRGRVRSGLNRIETALLRFFEKRGGGGREPRTGDREQAG